MGSKDQISSALLSKHPTLCSIRLAPFPVMLFYLDILSKHLPAVTLCKGSAQVGSLMSQVEVNKVMHPG